jgi:hypothetical protein
MVSACIMRVAETGDDGGRLVAEGDFPRRSTVKFSSGNQEAVLPRPSGLNDGPLQNALNSIGQARPFGKGNPRIHAEHAERSMDGNQERAGIIFPLVAIHDPEEEPGGAFGSKEPPGWRGDLRLRTRYRGHYVGPSRRGCML